MKYTPEYLALKKERYKKYQREYYKRVTKLKRRAIGITNGIAISAQTPIS